MLFLVSKGIKEFCEAMVDNPQDWVQGRYEFINQKHPDMAIWTTNGAFYIKIGGNDSLTLAEKWYVRKAIAQTQARKLRMNANG